MTGGIGRDFCEIAAAANVNPQPAQRTDFPAVESGSTCRWWHTGFEQNTSIGKVSLRVLDIGRAEAARSAAPL